MNMTPVVKKLEWQVIETTAGDIFTAKEYRVAQWNKPKWSVNCIAFQQLETPELARAAAQADYTARIIAALDPAWLARVEAQLKAADGLEDAFNALPDVVESEEILTEYGVERRWVKRPEKKPGYAALIIYRAAKEAMNAKAN
jgi:hypothetical protein